MIGNHVCGQPYRGFESHTLRHFDRLGYAKRGGSGALDLQSAIAGLNYHRTVNFLLDCQWYVVLRAGS